MAKLRLVGELLLYLGGVILFPVYMGWVAAESVRQIVFIPKRLVDTGAPVGDRGGL